MIRKFTAARTRPASRIFHTASPLGTQGWAGEVLIPSPYSTAHAAVTLSVEEAPLKAARCTALRSARHTPIVDSARSSTATGRPQAISAARPNVTEATGASTLERPGVTIGHMSPRTIIAARTQNSGCPASGRRPENLLMANPKTTAPAIVVSAMWIQRGDPTRGPMSLVSLGSLMAPSSAPAGR